VITLIHGGESYLVDRAARDLLLPLRAGLTLEFNYEDIQAEALNADAFAEKAGTLPFIDALRVLVLRDWGLLAGKRDKGAGAERAAAYMEGTPDSTHLVLVAHVLVASGNPIYKVVAAMERDKRARIQRYEPPRRSDRAGWVRKLAEERDLTITPAAVRLLLERSQPDLRLLDQEIVKLALYSSPSTRIDDEAVRALVSDSREEEIFALTDSLASGRPGAAAVAPGRWARAHLAAVHAGESLAPAAAGARDPRPWRFRGRPAGAIDGSPLCPRKGLPPGRRLQCGRARPRIPRSPAHRGTDQVGRARCPARG